METAISNLSVLPETKEQLESFVSKVENEIANGEVNPLQFWTKLTYYEKLIKSLKESEVIKSEAINEAGKYPEKNIEAFGCKIQIVSHANYDYSNCQDGYFNRLILQKQQLDESIKERQVFLQSMKDSVADPETGNVIYPAAKTFTEYLKVTLKK